MIREQWAVLAIVGFWGWVFCCIGFIWRGFPRQAVFVSRTAIRWGGGILVFFVLWFCGMVNA